VSTNKNTNKNCQGEEVGLRLLGEAALGSSTVSDQTTNGRRSEDILEVDPATRRPMADRTARWIKRLLGDGLIEIGFVDHDGHVPVAKSMEYLLKSLEDRSSISAMTSGEVRD
jgi:hypothetical protein